MRLRDSDPFANLQKRNFKVTLYPRGGMKIEKKVKGARNEKKEEKIVGKKTEEKEKNGEGWGKKLSISSFFPTYH